MVSKTENGYPLQNEGKEFKAVLKTLGQLWNPIEICRTMRVQQKKKKKQIKFL